MFIAHQFLKMMIILAETTTIFIIYQRNNLASFNDVCFTTVLERNKPKLIIAQA